jgi:hypothetical protein
MAPLQQGELEQIFAEAEGENTQAGEAPKDAPKQDRTLPIPDQGGKPLDPLEESHRDAVRKVMRTFGAGAEEMVRAARSTLKAMDTDGRLSEILERTGLGDDADVISQFYDDEAFKNRPASEIVRELEEELCELGLACLAKRGGPTRAEARSAINAILADETHPYHSSKFGDKIHRAVCRLFQIALDE